MLRTPVEFPLFPIPPVGFWKGRSRVSYIITILGSAMEEELTALGILRAGVATSFQTARWFQPAIRIT
jgi:hypothetical protein